MYVHACVSVQVSTDSDVNMYLGVNVYNLKAAHVHTCMQTKVCVGMIVYASIYASVYYQRTCAYAGMSAHYTGMCAPTAYLHMSRLKGRWTDRQKAPLRRIASKGSSHSRMDADP